MSESAPERRGGQPPPGKQGKGFDKKLAGVPVWVWAVGAAAAAAAFYLWRKNKTAAANQAAAATLPSTGNAVDFSGQIATIQSEIQAMQQGESGESRDRDRDGKSHHHHKQGWTRHVTDGKDTLSQLAQESQSSPAELFTWLRESPATEDDVRHFSEWFEHPNRKLKGLVYYTPAASSTAKTPTAADAATIAADTTGSGGGTDGGSTSGGALSSGQATAQPAAVNVTYYGNGNGTGGGTVTGGQGGGRPSGRQHRTTQRKRRA